MKQTKHLFLLFCGFFLSVGKVSAHVKWFAEEVVPVRPYEITDFPVLFSILVVVVLVLIGRYLDRKLTLPHWFHNSIQKVAPWVLSLASIGFGLSFLIFSYYGFIFAPNLIVVGEFGKILLGLQTIAGAMILFGFYERVGGLLLIVLFGLSIKNYGAYEMMDTLEMLGFAFYAMIIGRPKWHIKESHFFSRILHPLHPYGVSLLRIGTGINLMILGFSEKILSPSLTQDFLSKYDWNFMQNIGFTWFTDYWFAYSAGVAEFLFGLFFLLGLVTRISIVALAVFLVTTLALLGPIELIGHLPHFSIACVLFIFGAGSRMHRA